MKVEVHLSLLTSEYGAPDASINQKMPIYDAFLERSLIFSKQARMNQDYSVLSKDKKTLYKFRTQKCCLFYFYNNQHYQEEHSDLVALEVRKKPLVNLLLFIYSLDRDQFDLIFSYA